MVKSNCWLNVATYVIQVLMCVCVCVRVRACVCVCVFFALVRSKLLYYQGADKSLARPGRKQATATKLLTFASHSKQFRRLSIQPGLHSTSDLHVR